MLRFQVRTFEGYFQGMSVVFQKEKYDRAHKRKQKWNLAILRSINDPLFEIPKA